MTGFIKIIGGQFKGKKIIVPDAMDLRPTPNRLRESLFNVLQFNIKQAVCLDAFAGTGALGLEAASRGAAQVVFLENNAKVYQSLDLTLKAFQHPHLTAIKTDCLHYLEHCKQKFDVIFLDPPFRQSLWETCILHITQQQLLNEDGILYIESPAPIEMNEKFWSLIKQGKMGDVYFGIYQLSTEL